VVTLPWLTSRAALMWRIIVVALLMGAGNFALLFMGLKTASPLGGLVIIQLGVPLTTHAVGVHARRAHPLEARLAGIGLTLAGACDW
jgi:O-acetylserine/cysteine efflux transporter